MKPSLPQGTRDFGPETVRKRQYILDTIRSVFELYGFQPIETPAFENLETLMGKYGEEGDKLIFKILNNGLERTEKHAAANEDFKKVLEGKNVTGFTERALKYDLTIPFARYVAMNHGQMTFPFKRYQIQPVWRADRPQRGRYREFTQCDADVVGSQSLFNEIELIQIYLDVFKKLTIDVHVCINNRKILAGLATLCGGPEKMTTITIAIDKLDKIGIDKVNDELRQRGNDEASITIINHYLDIAQQDVTLARGLNYYTGSILEVKPLGIQMGSIGGGGRYDDLTGLFGVPNIPGVGISFGVDRMYDVMDEMNKFPTELTQSVQIMLVNFGEEFEKRNIEVLKALRAEHISCELFPDAIKFDKQLKYANKRAMPFIAMIGEEELKEAYISVKNFNSGEQKKMNLSDMIALLKG